MSMSRPCHAVTGWAARSILSENLATQRPDERRTTQESFSGPRGRRKSETAENLDFTRASRCDIAVSHGNVTPVVTVSPTRPDPTRPILRVTAVSESKTKSSLRSLGIGATR